MSKLNRIIENLIWKITSWVISYDTNFIVNKNTRIAAVLSGTNVISLGTDSPHSSKDNIITIGGRTVLPDNISTELLSDNTVYIVPATQNQEKYHRFQNINFGGNTMNTNAQFQYDLIPLVDTGVSATVPALSKILTASGGGILALNIIPGQVIRVDNLILEVQSVDSDTQITCVLQNHTSLTVTSNIRLLKSSQFAICNYVRTYSVPICYVNERGEWVAKQGLQTQGVFKAGQFTATEASALTPANGDFIYATSTNATFTSVGFWGYVSGAWAKL